MLVAYAQLVVDTRMRQVQRRRAKRRLRPARRVRAPSQYTAEERNEAFEIVAKAMDEASGCTDVRIQHTGATSNRMLTFGRAVNR